MSNAGHPDPADEITQDLRPRMPPRPTTAAVEEERARQYVLNLIDDLEKGERYLDAYAANVRAAALDVGRLARAAEHIGLRMAPDWWSEVAAEYARLAEAER